MPLYEYKCPECGQMIEKVRAIKDRDNEVRCTACQTICTKVISVPYYKDDCASWKPQNRPDMKNFKSVKDKKYKI